MECEVRRKLNNLPFDGHYKSETPDFGAVMNAYNKFNYMIYRGKVEKIQGIELSGHFVDELERGENLFKTESEASLELIKRKI